MLICSERNQRLLSNSVQKTENNKKLQVAKCLHSHQAFLNAFTALPNIQNQGRCWEVMATGQEKWAWHKKTLAPILVDKSCFCSNCGPLRDSAPQLHLPMVSGELALLRMVRLTPRTEAADASEKRQSFPLVSPLAKLHITKHSRIYKGYLLSH